MTILYYIEIKKEIQDKIIVNGKSYIIHPVYNIYASSEE